MTSPWTPARDARLTELWAGSGSTADIADDMGFGREGKNKIIGRAHRLGLPARPSPIRTRDGSKYVAPPKQPGVWEIARARAAQERRAVVHSEQQIALPLAVPTERFAANGGHTMPLDWRASGRAAIRGVTLAGVEAAAEPRLAPIEAGGCRFIAGEPAGRHTVFCDAPRRQGSSFCPEHHARCWVKREPAAVVRSVEDARAVVGDGGGSAP